MRPSGAGAIRSFTQRRKPCSARAGERRSAARQKHLADCGRACSLNLTRAASKRPAVPLRMLGSAASLGCRGVWPAGHRREWPPRRRSRSARLSSCAGLLCGVHGRPVIIPPCGASAGTCFARQDGLVISVRGHVAIALSRRRATCVSRFTRHGVGTQIGALFTTRDLQRATFSDGFAHGWFRTSAFHRRHARA